jgi:hypothetical protein
MRGICMSKKIFEADTMYQENILQYKKVDGMIALAFYVVFLVTYYFMGVLQAKKGIYILENLLT